MLFSLVMIEQLNPWLYLGLTECIENNKYKLLKKGKQFIRISLFEIKWNKSSMFELSTTSEQMSKLLEMYMEEVRYKEWILEARKYREFSRILDYVVYLLPVLMSPFSIIEWLVRFYFLLWLWCWRYLINSFTAENAQTFGKRSFYVHLVLLLTRFADFIWIFVKVKWPLSSFSHWP